MQPLPQPDRCRSVGTADDGNRRRRLTVEAEKHRQQVSRINSELRRCAEQETHRVCNQRTEIRHRTDTHEDERRKNTPLVKLIEIMQESAASIRGLCRIQHNIRINIHQKHTERNRNKE